MIRLTVRSQTHDEAVLQVDGWVSGEEVKILEEEGTRLLEEAHRLVLELRGVQFFDERGIALLQRWQGERLVLRNGPPFVRALLEEHGLARSGVPQE